MPFGIHKHSNRSKQALNDSAGHGSHSPSSGRSESPTSAPAPGSERAAAQPSAYLFTARNDLQSQSYAALNTGQGVPQPDQSIYQPASPLPSRSQSTRYSSNSYPPHPALVQAGASTDNLTHDAQRSDQQEERATAALTPPTEHKKSRNIFDRMRSSTSRSEQKHSSTPSQSSLYNNTGGLARRLSKRQEAPPVIRTAQQRNSTDQQQRQDWQNTQGPQGSKSHLPSPLEAHEDDHGLDPYQITDPSQVENYNPENDLGPHQTIRTVVGDADQQPYEDPHQRYSFHQQQQQQQLYQQQQQRNSQIYVQSQDVSPQSPNQQLNQQYSQNQGNLQPGNLAIRDPYQQLQNSDTVSQISHDSPVYQEDEQRPISVQSNGQSPTAVYPNPTTSIQGPRPLSQVGSMAGQGPGRAGQQTRRPGEQEQNAPSAPGQQDGRGPPPEYRREPSTPGLAPRGPNYQGGPPQRDQFGPNGGGDQGRNTPPPAPDRDINDAYKELCRLQFSGLIDLCHPFFFAKSL